MSIGPIGLIGPILSTHYSSLITNVFQGGFLLSNRDIVISVRCVAIMLGLLLLSSNTYSQTKLLRFPDISGDKVVFTYAGDLWTAPASGGAAIRLTSHPGIEVFGKFSPDGKWIAFTGQYDGDEQVYVVPTSGGEPRQLTFYPARGPLAPRWGWDNQVFGWSKDGKRIFFRSLRDSWSLPIAKLYSVAVDGGPAEALPMPTAGSGDYSPTGAEVVYSPQSRDFRSEKRYGGGQANELYIFNLQNNSAKRITEGPRATRDAMWIGDTIFFNSDRDGHFNLYAYTVSSGRTTQVTANKQWDVRWPSSDNEGQIVYELDGELQVMDARSKKSTPISITVPDEGLARRPSRIPVGNMIETAGLSPKGERVVIAARGDVFTLPIEKGPTRNLTQSSGAHDKWPSWSPDGSQIAYISDKSGEEELYLEAQDGSKPAEQITSGGTAMRYQPEWAPDGKRLAFGDKDGKVFIVTLADRKVAEIADTTRGQIRDYVWSPRGNYLAFTMSNANQLQSVYVWSASDNQVRRVTEEYFNSYNPAWDPQANYLYFLSDREFAPQLSSIEFNYALNRPTYIYAIALKKEGKHPFPPESDEVTISKTEEPKPTASPAAEKPAEGAAAAPEAKPEATAPKPPANLVIDFVGIEKRVARVPLPAENYGGRSAKTGHLLYLVGGAGYNGRQGARNSSLRIYAIK